ncbi:MAG TPA: hypothetical protein VI756_15110 [Blastocatellia bacterium]
MKIVVSTLKKTLFWSYDRGSWQYDVLCVVILAFIFLSPNRPFHGTQQKPKTIVSEAATQTQPPRSSGADQGRRPADTRKRATRNLAQVPGEPVK